MEASEKKKFFIIDGNAYIYRAFYAITELTTSTGIPTNAVFGFTSLILKLLREDKPDYIAIAFDTPEPTFRHKAYADYKSDRQPMPDPLAQQIPVIREMLEAFNIPILEMPGYEADDVIGTLAKKVESAGMEAFLVTGDKDAFQLVSPNIKVYPCGFRGMNPEGFAYNEQAVKEKHGVEPAKITDIMGLIGDKVDSIPGVPGIGEKTAPVLINQFGSLENLLECADDVKSENQKRLLKEYKDQALLSKKLATIDLHVPIQIDLEKCKVSDLDHDKVLNLFRRLEFRKFIQELNLTPSQQEKVEVKYHTILKEPELDELIDKLKNVSEFAVDTEASGVDPITSNLVGISIAYQSHEAYYIPVYHRYIGVPEQLPTQLVIDKLIPVLADPKIGKIGQNIKYDLQLLRRYGVQINGISFDTMLASYVLNPSARGHDLDTLSMDYIGHKMIPIEELIGKGKNQTTMEEVEIERASQYSCEDADITLQLKHRLESELQKNDLESVFREIELPLIPVLADIEMTGIKIDTASLAIISSKMSKSLEELTRKIYDLAGQEFNINSPKQLGEILFDKLKLPSGKKTKTGYSTNEAELERLAAAKYEIPSLILEYRSVAKLKSTYVDALPQSINPRTGRIHTSFNQAVTETGRLSSSNPNLQNIPIRTEEGREIRGAFIPGEDSDFILTADYSQIELRMLAHLSGDPVLTLAFQKGDDIHTRTASLIFGVPIDQVSSDMRRQAKTVNFGVIYGMGAFRLARELDITLADAQRFIDSYFQTYAGVKAYFDGIIQFARQNGYVATISGRRRRISEIHSRDRNIREFAERTAINTPVQGSAADLIKVAMIKIAEFLKSNNLKTKLLLQVHDELVFEAPEMELDTIKDNVKLLMEKAIPLNVPVKVDIGIGKSWLDAK
jgi:DNA polymerase-1